MLSTLNNFTSIKSAACFPFISCMIISCLTARRRSDTKENTDENSDVVTDSRLSDGKNVFEAF